MAWIKEIEVQEADGKLKELYDRITARTKGSVANILKVHSIHPDVMETHLVLYEKIMFGESGLSRSQREMIAVVVSSTNSCNTELSITERLSVLLQMMMKLCTK